MACLVRTHEHQELHGNVCHVFITKTTFSQGQFWNIPVEAVKLTDQALLDSLPVEYDQTQLYLVTVKPESSNKRTFLGELFDRHWDSYRSPCLYVGNSQVSNPLGMLNFPATLFTIGLNNCIFLPLNIGWFIWSTRRLSRLGD